jgi:CRP-like cAMP-binding protein
VIEKSHIIECSLEDHIIEKDNAQKTLFVVLSGMVEVYRESKLLAVIFPGEVIGEVAFFLKRPRSATIIAATEDVRLLSLDEPSMSRLLKYEPVLANKILNNLCRLLCSRLIGGIETSDLRSS